MGTDGAYIDENKENKVCEQKVDQNKKHNTACGSDPISTTR